MSAESEFEVWFAAHVAKLQEACATPIDLEMEEEKCRYKAAFLAAYALGRKAGVKDAEAIVDAASHVRENLASCPLEIQAMVDHNGWITVLRELLNKRAIRQRIEETP